LGVGQDLWRAAFRRLISPLLRCMIPLSTIRKSPNPKVINGPRRI
jgi:hypothetical protein